MKKRLHSNPNQTGLLTFLLTPPEREPDWVRHNNNITGRGRRSKIQDKEEALCFW